MYFSRVYWLQMPTIWEQLGESMCVIDEKNKIEYRKYLKTGKKETILSVKTAIIAGYLDVCRTPLKGINSCIKGGSITARDGFINNHFSPAIKELKKDGIDFDKWHEQLCKCIHDTYSEYGYKEFTVGKAQKWINMSLKYIWLYSADSFVEEHIKIHISKLHMPIDRVIAGDIAKTIGFLPGYDDIKFDSLNDSFDGYKDNYCWSKIADYGEYLECQRTLREKLKEISPIYWEFCKWNNHRKEVKTL